MGMSSMRLLYVTNTSISLSETFIAHLLGGLARAGHEVVFACPPGRVPEISGVRVQQLETDWRVLSRPMARMLLKVAFGASWEHRRVSMKQVRARRNLASLGRAVRPDIVVFDYGTTAAACHRWAMAEGLPFVVLINGYDASSALADRGYAEALSQACSSSLLTVAPCGHLARRLRLIGVPAERLEVIPYSPDYDRIERVSHVAEVPGRVASLGRLHPQKCPVALVHMMDELRREVPAAELMVVGDGPSRGEAERAISRLGLERHVKLLGSMEHERALEVMASASVFVQHSVTTDFGDQEGFPVALAEAAAMGKAIVSTVHSGIPENVVDGDTGFLVQEHDFHAHAGRVAQLLQDDSLRRRLGEAARQRIRTICPPHARADRLTSSIASRLRKI
jgi:colanic acid/amylovoran biosynthesis glycosyltransferase